MCLVKQYAVREFSRLLNQLNGAPINLKLRDPVTWIKGLPQNVITFVQPKSSHPVTYDLKATNPRSQSSIKKVLIAVSDIFGRSGLAA